MLGDMKALKASLVGGGGELDALVVKLRDRPRAVLNVIEKSDFHAYPSLTLARKG
jgi:hypothetical protein